MDNSKLEKVRIDLPNHWATGGESMWAESLGDDMYRIENIPFYAYGLNYQDVVLAIAESDELKPEILKVIQPSGHRTIRFFFKKDKSRDEQEKVLESLRSFQVSFERMNGIYIAMDIKPTCDYNAVFDRLDELEKMEVLSFETCEERVKGSFDDVAEEENIN